MFTPDTSVAVAIFVLVLLGICTALAVTLAYAVVRAIID